MEINLYATLRPIVRQKTIEVELKPGANAQDLIEALVAKYPSMDPELLDKNRRLLPPHEDVYQWQGEHLP